MFYTQLRLSYVDYCTFVTVNCCIRHVRTESCASFSIDMSTEDLCAWLKKNKLPERDVCKVKGKQNHINNNIIMMSFKSD